MGAGSRLLHLLGNPVSHTRRRLFSSSAALTRRFWKALPEKTKPESEDPESQSSVYKQALKFQRPETIKFQENFYNSISFIGTIDRPFMRFGKSDKRFDLHTVLKVQKSLSSGSCFRVTLHMRNEMAEMSLMHLKPGDFVYVSGYLESSENDKNGNPVIYYSLAVKEINFVRRPVQCQADKLEKSKSGGISVEERLQKRRDRLHLWQIFFANPYEWRDLRKCKTNPRGPDFKHKDTGEALWLNENDPPWIKKQLEWYDSRMGKRNTEAYKSYHSRLSPLLYDDAE